MKMNKLEFLNIFRNGMVINLERYDKKSYEKILKNLVKIKKIIDETETFKEQLNIMNTYSITSIDNRNIISNVVLDEYDILIKLLDDNTLSFIISTEFLSFLNVDENIINATFVESEDGSLYICDYIQFIKLIDGIIESLNYELLDITLNDDFVEIVTYMSNEYPPGDCIVDEEEFYNFNKNVTEGED